jgi:hypothetical protein
MAGNFPEESRERFGREFSAILQCGNDGAEVFRDIVKAMAPKVFGGFLPEGRT